MDQNLRRILCELTQCAQLVSADAVALAAQKISAHERIFVYGAGRSGLMLKALAMRLCQMGKTVYVVGETITPALEAQDLLLLASASGHTESVLRYARRARGLGAELLIITGSDASPLCEIAPADLLIPAASKRDDGASAQPMGSAFEQMLLLAGDALILHLAQDIPAMRARHANLE